jgi:hypothetical protein
MNHDYTILSEKRMKIEMAYNAGLINEEEYTRLLSYVIDKERRD